MVDARPVLLERRDYMAIRGLHHQLRERRLVQAADAVERIANRYEASEHLAVVDRHTLLEHNAKQRKQARRRHGRARGR